MIIKEKAFESFTWIDIENANKKELEIIASKYNLNYFLIKDALDIGHLPKYEQLHQHDFFIFRAYTSNVNLNIDEIGEMSNKIAFFIFDDKLITIHRASFEFLNIEEDKHIKISALFLRIVGFMIDSFKTPTLELSNKITEIEKTIFLKDYRVVLIEELYFIKTQSRILKKIISLNLLSKFGVIAIERDGKVKAFTWPPSLTELKVRSYGAGSIHYGVHTERDA